MPVTVRARARPNIALVKYWGKRDAERNLPATGSLSLTLSELDTTTEVTFDPALRQDELRLDGEPASEAARRRVSGFLDRVRDLARGGDFARVVSVNRFPTAAGLASSASGFAALALAATHAAGLQLPLDELAALARHGSGSAPRSLLGGFVAVHPGGADDGADWRIEALGDADFWDLRLVVALTATGPKAVGSSEGMERTRTSSPYYAPWLAANARHLDEARRALRARDFTALGRVTEASCFRMHAAALAADPPLLYWNGATVAAIHRVWQLRGEGHPAYVTIDAGPHVKVLCQPTDAEVVAAGLRSMGRDCRLRLSEETKITLA